MIDVERIYLGGVYEKDTRSYEGWNEALMDMIPRTETIQRLFLGGTAYDAPMVLVKIANARLYDPITGRFLSPDPLKYTDPDGEFALSATAVILIIAAVFGLGNLGAHAIRGDDLGQWNWAKYFVSGALAGAAVGAIGYYGIPYMLNSQYGLVRLIGKQTVFNLKWVYPSLMGINFVGNLYNGIACTNSATQSQKNTSHITHLTSIITRYSDEKDYYINDCSFRFSLQ